MDLSRGCVLIARSLDESDIFQNEKWLKVWIWCLIQANHKGRSVPVNIGRSTSVVFVERGQFIFGRNQAAKKLNMPPSTVRNIMDKLKKCKNLDIKEDSHYSLVTIIDYDIYQDLENYKGQAKGQAEDKQRTGGGQPKDTTIYVKNEKNVKKKDTVKKPESVPDQIWNDWLIIRKNKKLTLTETALNGVIKQAEIAGMSIEQAIRISVENSWAGFKAEWVNKAQQSNGNLRAQALKQQTDDLLKEYGN